MVGFAVAGGYAVEGYTDLVWAAFAVGAVIWGLVLPRSPRALAVAWICAAAASLTKNEGLTTALIIIAAIALRYRPFSLPGPMARRWAERARLVPLPALPGLAWAGMMRLIGVHDAFFTTRSPEARFTRAGATVLGMAGYLHVAPLALAVLLTGCWFLRADRQRAGLANPVWLPSGWSSPQKALSAAPQLAPIAIRPQPASTCRKYSTIPASPSRSDTLGSRPGRRSGRFRAMAAYTRAPTRAWAGGERSRFALAARSS